MKAFLIGVAIVIGVAVILVFAVSVFIPQEVTDFFMNFGANSFEVGRWGEKGKVEFNSVEEGMEPRARLYLMKKMIAFYIVVEGELKFKEEQEEFDLALVAAAEDKLLTIHEFEHLKSLHSDIITDKDVDNWIALAKKYEAIKEKRPPGIEQKENFN